MKPSSLHQVLACNLSFSFLSGVTLLTATSWFSQLFPKAPASLFLILGGGLVLFALDIAWTLRKPELPKSKIWYFSIGDLLWVASSLIILAFTHTLHPLGQVLIWVTSAIVLLFAVLQIINLESLNKHFPSNSQ